MFVFAIWVAVCLVDYTVKAVVLPEKPFYDLEDAEKLFEDFLKEYEKSYKPREHKERLEIFKKTLEEINDRNARHPQTVFAVNHFADLTLEERQQYFGFKPLNSTPVNVDIPNITLPASFDWRDKGVVSPVQNQGFCGSCYIFSAMGSIEGQYAIKHDQCPDLSEGQALDCLDCGWCQGGWMHHVMREFARRPCGVMTEADYPYKPEKGECHEDKKKTLAHVTGGHHIRIPDETALQQKLVQLGPLAVALAADDLFNYFGGILHPDSCKGRPLDHGVVLVGYGEENGTKFWILKNSWGLRFGEKGYFRLVRGVRACTMGVGYTATATVA